MEDIHFLNLEYFFNKIVGFFVNIGQGGVGPSFANFIRTVIPIIIILLIAAIVYYYIRIKEKLHHHHEETNTAIVDMEAATAQNSRWEKVKDLFDSNSPSDWRLAIIEADSMLEELITELGYDGDTLGEKLKSMEQGDLKEYQSAWDAHLVRNKIAHEGLEFQLSEREKIRVKRLYERVFKEVGYI